MHILSDVVGDLRHVADLASLCKLVSGLFKLFRATVAQTLLALNLLEKLLHLGFLHKKKLSFLGVESLSQFVEGLLDLHAGSLFMV
jgi:hypothetical protein